MEGGKTLVDNPLDIDTWKYSNFTAKRMYKFIAFLFLCLSVLSCRDKSDKNTGNRESQTNQVLGDNKEIIRVRNRMDSLINLVQTLRGSENNIRISNYLRELLSNALYLNNDSLLAKAYFSLGAHFDHLTDYATSVDYYYKALELYQKQQQYNGATVSLNNMSWAYIQALDYKKGIEQGFKGIKLAKNITDSLYRTRMISFLFNNISIAYLEMGLPDSALKYNELSYSSYPKLKVKTLNHYAWIFAQFGNIYTFKRDHIKAEECFKKVKEIKDSASATDATVFAFSRYCHLLNSLFRYNEAIALGKDGIRIGRNSGDIRYLIDITEELRYSYEELQQIDSAYLYAKLSSELRDSIFNAKKSFELQNMSFIRDLKANELAYEIEKVKAEDKLTSAQRLQNIFLVGFVFVLLFAGLFLYQRNKIKAGKIRSDELLLNILPGEVADELKSNGTTTARQFENVTVMFTDFKNFTQIAERLSPQELVNEIHTCFKVFDQIIEKYHIEKIKTIGDAYMCAGGLPVSNTTHAHDVVGAALEIQQFVHHHLEQRRIEGKELFEMRIGIHTGPVVAGIVGIKKFAYDIWGDTVNTASRMESSGEVGKVNISGSTYQMIKDQYTCTFRGKILVKNKGELDMYFVEGRS